MREMPLSFALELLDKLKHNMDGEVDTITVEEVFGRRSTQIESDHYDRQIRGSEGKVHRLLKAAAKKSEAPPPIVAKEKNAPQEPPEDFVADIMRRLAEESQDERPNDKRSDEKHSDEKK